MDDSATADDALPAELIEGAGKSQDKSGIYKIRHLKTVRVVVYTLPLFSDFPGEDRMLAC